MATKSKQHFPPKPCEKCGVEMHKTANLTPSGWARRRFCGKRCAGNGNAIKATPTVREKRGLSTFTPRNYLGYDAVQEVSLPPAPEWEKRT